MEDSEAINDVIEEMTTTAQQELNAEDLKRLKELCRKSAENIKFCFDTVMVQLVKEHAEIRYSSFQIIDVLFRCSHFFRQLVVFHLPLIFEMTIESERKRSPLPPPLHIAKQLKSVCLRKYHNWYQRYGQGYYKLQLGFEFLRDVKKIKFEEFQIQTFEEQERIQKKREKEKRLKNSKQEQVEIQFYDMFPSMESTCKQMQRCFELVVPKIDVQNENSNKNPKISQQESNDENTESVTKNRDAKLMDIDLTYDVADAMEAGIVSSNFSISVSIPSTQTIVETEDNAVILNELTELHVQIQKHLSTAKRWLNVLVKCKSQNKHLIKQVLDLKNQLSALNHQYLDVNIKEEGDDDFVDVLEKPVVTLIETQGLESKNKDVDNSVQRSFGRNQDCAVPGSSKDMDGLIKYPSGIEEKLGPSKEDLMKIAPVIEYDTDLKYWDSESIDVPNSMKYDSLHRFWKTSEHVESFVPPQIEASMRERWITMNTKFEPVQRKCGALMPSGMLCQRMDRLKCPFHGLIIERDSFGRPKDPDEAEKELKQKREQENKDRENIQREIDAALGTSLSHSNSKKRKRCAKAKKNERYSRLTKIKDGDNTPTSRLSKKIFSSRSLDKIYSAMDTQVRKQHDEKFGSHFNYY